MTGQTAAAGTSRALSLSRGTTESLPWPRGRVLRPVFLKPLCAGGVPPPGPRWAETPAHAGTGGRGRDQTEIGPDRNGTSLASGTPGAGRETDPGGHTSHESPAEGDAGSRCRGLGLPRGVKTATWEQR